MCLPFSQDLLLILWLSYARVAHKVQWCVVIFQRRHSRYQGNREFFLGDGGHLSNLFPTLMKLKIDGRSRNLGVFVVRDSTCDSIKRWSIGSGCKEVIKGKVMVTVSSFA